MLWLFNAAAKENIQDNSMLLELHRKQLKVHANFPWLVIVKSYGALLPKQTCKESANMLQSCTGHCELAFALEYCRRLCLHNLKQPSYHAMYQMLGGT